MIPYVLLNADALIICTVKHYFRCILNVEISLRFNLAFSHCSTSIYQAFDGQTEFLQVFNFVILSYSRNSRKFDAHKKCFLQYILGGQ